MKKLFIFLLFFCWVHLSSGQSGMKVMTFNIRYDNPGDGEFSWQQRLPLVNDLLQNELPDILCFQEVLKNQADDLQKMLPGYSWSGVGRDDGQEKGEYSAIFFRARRFQKKAGSTFWLSETPGIPGSRSWNTACTRIVTWVELKDKKSGQTYFIFNTHFDHESPLARAESAKLLLLKIDEIAGSSASIITGDFNDTLKSETLQILTTGPNGLENTRDLSAISPDGPDYSFVGFPFNPRKGDVIDFILLKNQGKITVRCHRTITFHIDDKYPSDHLPVCAELEIPTR